jgi:hypothetical protein
MNDQKIISAAIAFALDCSYEGIVKRDLYLDCAEACGVEYDPDHQDFLLEGEPEYDESPHIRWEKTVQDVLEKAKGEV